MKVKRPKWRLCFCALTAPSTRSVGKTALYLSQLAGFSVPASTKVLIAEQTTVSHQNPYSREKLCPILGLYVEEDWKAACHRVMELLTNEASAIRWLSIPAIRM